MDSSVIITHPTPLMLDNMLAVAAPGSEPGAGMRTSPLDTSHHLRACVWASLLHLRRAHGSLAAASRAASERRRAIQAVADRGRAS